MAFGMVEREPHILIVDDERGLARVLRTSLEMLDRGYIVKDVPSGEEALLEIGRAEFDLLVCDYWLPGMSGLELIEHVRRKIPDTKALLITGHEVDLDDQIEALGIIEVMYKPIEVALFIEVVQHALYGEEPDVAPVIDADLGPIPEFDKAMALSHLSSLQIDLGASAVVLVDWTGQTVIESGLLDSSLRFDRLSALLAHNFTATTEIAACLGEQAPSALHYYEGDLYDIYALSVGAHFFMVMVFPGGSQNRMGPVMRYGKRAATGLLEIIGPETAPAERPARPAAKPTRAAEKVTKAKPAKKEAEPAAATQVDGMNLDALDQALEGEVPDPDAFWEEAAEQEAAQTRTDAISLKEAIELGLIPKDLDLD
jgi:CheY-like chemotaxis protein